MGHTTRCIPLIEYFIEKNYEVYVAVNHTSLQVLKPVFPTIHFFEIKGYNVKYAKSRWALPFVLLFQIPKILLAIYREHQWLKKILHSYRFHFVVSDNRYGFFSKNTKSIFITHQLNILVPQSKVLAWIVQQVNHYFLKKYDEIWVPDYKENTQSGKLSASQKALKNVKYIGNLSRFSTSQICTEIKYDVCVLLSGPEPQRSILENKILQQMQTLQYNLVLVRGIKNEKQMQFAKSEYMMVYDFVNMDELEKLIQSSRVLICRSGYSTVMDLMKLNKHAILIPTPGQTEQEYLADYLSQMKWFNACHQNHFNLNNEVQTFSQTHFKAFPALNFQLFQKVIDEI